MESSEESGSLDDGRITFDRDDGLTELVVRDPVCGMEVEPAAAAGSSTHDDKIYYFCSLSCKGQFDADPERYVG
jgi:Cu+-exporting ATPase